MTKAELLVAQFKAEREADEKVIVNVGEYGGYVMVEQPRAGWVLITVINDEGDVLMEREFDTLAHNPDVKLREV